MPRALGDAEFAILEGHVAAGDRIAYYQQLDDWGFRYGDLANGVVKNDSISGATANIYFGQEYLKDNGVTITFNDLASLSLDLMEFDFAARQRSDEVMRGEDMHVDDINEYHQAVFRTYNAQPDAWTPYIALEQIETPEERQDFWDSLLDAGTAMGNAMSYINILTAVGVSQPRYVFDVTAAGTLAVTADSTDYGPYAIEIGNGGGQSIGGNGEANGLLGTMSNDVLMGFDGDDFLFASDGDDRLYGGPGSDVLLGEAGSDQLYGGGGDDFLFAARLEGSEFVGNLENKDFDPNFARVTSGQGNLASDNGAYSDNTADHLFGGEGFDRYFVSSTVDGDTYLPKSDGNKVILNEGVYDHIDIVEDTDGRGEIYYTLYDYFDEGPGFIDFFSSDESIVLEKSEFDFLEEIDLRNVSEPNRENYHAFGGFLLDERIDAETGLNEFWLLAYEAEFKVGFWAIKDFHNGDFGITVRGVAGIPTRDRNPDNDDDTDIRGTPEDDVLNGTDGNDRMFGGGADDVLNGGAGDDRLDGGFGDDHINGGEGFDVFVFDGDFEDAEFEFAKNWDFRVRDGDAVDGSDLGLDRVSGVEQIDFADGTTGTVDTSGKDVVINFVDGQEAEIGQAVFDKDGNSSWESYRILFDAAGNPASQTRIYDDGRVQSTSYTDGVRTEAITTDVENARGWETITRVYDDAGELAEKTTAYDDGRDVTFVYDSNGDVLQTKETIYENGIRRETVTSDANESQDWDTITSTYNQEGIITRKVMIYDDGRDRDFFYDAEGTLRRSVTQDEEDVYSWSTVIRDYNAGVLALKTTFYDDGRTVRKSYNDNDCSTLDGNNSSFVRTCPTQQNSNTIDFSPETEFQAIDAPNSALQEDYLLF